LPRGANGQISRIAFVYDSEQDAYRCPGGALLPRRKVRAERKAGGTTLRSEFHDKAACSKCPLASRCLPKGASRRSLSRDQYEELRVDMRERMATPKGKRLYRQRSWAAETPWAYMKWVLGFTRFLRRGLASVRAE